MGLLRQLGRRVVSRLARRVGQDELFEKPGERAPTPPLAPAPPPARADAVPATAAPVPAAAAPVPAATLCQPLGLDALVEALRPQGRPVVVHHWATWCEPCEEEMPRVEALRQALAGQAELVGVSWDLFEGGGEADYVAGLVATWCQQLGVGMRSVLADADPERFFERLALGYRKIPQTQLYGADGRVVYTVDGPLDEARAQELLRLARGAA